MHARSTRSLHRPAVCSPPSPSPLRYTRMSTSIEQLPQPAPPLPASALQWYLVRTSALQRCIVFDLIENDTPDGWGRSRRTGKLPPLNSLRWVGCGIPSIVKESIELSICPLFSCARHFWPSDQSWPARAREQEQRVSDPLSAAASISQKHMRLKDEGSALEMAYSGGDRSH